MRYFFTVFICKIFIFVLHLFKFQATSAPGKLAFRLYPDILKEFQKRTKKEIIAILGTNGKTTTNNLLADIFENAEFDVVCNRVGANMDEGSVVAYIEKANLFGRISCDYACLEMDEGWAEYIFKYITPHKIIVTNLFRDQLDRYGEVNTTSLFLKRAISLAPDATLYINADDPVTTALFKDFNNPKVYYGVNYKVKDFNDTSVEGKLCPFCDSELKYNFSHFSQLGDYSCSCSFKRPVPTFCAENISLFPVLTFNVKQVGDISFPVRGMYNIYNILSCISVADNCNIPKNHITDAIENFVPSAGRMESFKINNKDIYLILAKNPAGFNQSVNIVTDDPRDKSIMLSINDGIGDGKDITWLWDVDFKKLYNPSTVNFYLSGTRYGDVALRLKYENINNLCLSEDFKENLKKTISDNASDCVYILANYTAVFPARKAILEVQNEY